MRKTLLSLILFFLLFAAIFGAAPLTKEARVKAIDAQIEGLLAQKEELEKLKQAILSENEQPIREAGTGKPARESARTPAKRPKVALVLSGGGARGAAHIGVLKALEEYQVPLDLVVGTSIGSFVGGMYAAGYSPAEIENTLVHTNFTSPFAAVSRKRPFTDVYEKLSYEKYPINFRVTRDMKISLPRGFVSNQQTYFDLKTIFSRAEDIKDFDALPIPFRAVATDLQTSKAAVVGSGDLALGVLKSMSFPSVFPPVEDKGRYYVDGGASNNFPIDVAIEMGADIIIAVNVSTDPIVIDEEVNLFTVVEQLSTFHGDMNTVFLKKLPTILIEPDVGDKKNMDFTDMAPLIARGYAAAQKYGQALRTLSDGNRFKALRNRAPREKDRAVDAVVLRGNKTLTLGNVNKLRPEKARQLSREEIDRWAKEIYSIPYVDKLYYHLEGDVLNFDVRERHDIHVRAALGYVSRYGAALKALVDFPQYGVWSRNYSIAAEISEYPKISIGNASYYDSMRFKIGSAFSLGYEQNPLFIFRNRDHVSTYRSGKFTGTADIFTSIYKMAVAGVSFTWESGGIAYDEGERGALDFERHFNRVMTGPYVAFDSLDNRIFPTKGVFFYAEHMRGSDRYSAYKLLSDFYLPLSKELSLSLGASYGKMTGERLTAEKLFKIGGGRFVNMKDHITYFGLPAMGRYTDEFAIASAGLQYRLRNSLYLMGKYNVLAYHSDKILHQKDRRLNEGVVTGYGVGVGWDTFVGPVAVFLTNDIDRKKKPIFEIRFGFMF